MTTLEALLSGIVADPREETRWLVLADCLEEYDDPRRAELLRLHRRLIASCCEPEAAPSRAECQARMVELLLAGAEPCVPRHTLKLPSGVALVGAFIPPGSFQMGSTKYDDEKPVHKVTLTRGFFMGIHPVTQTQWKAVMGSDPSHFKGPQCPVEQVSWEDAQKFCGDLTALLKKRGLIKDKMKVCLPTEAEWEYACRAGTTSEYWSGNSESDLVRVGWFAGNSGSQTHPVGEKEANPWGLYDVHGNVWEWCEDWYVPYKREDQIDPRQSTKQSDEYRVLRGGAWSDFPGNCVAACRLNYTPATRGSDYGFRVCFRLD